MALQDRPGRSILQRALSMAQMPAVTDAEISRQVAEITAMASVTQQSDAVVKALTAYQDGMAAVTKDMHAQCVACSDRRDALRAQLLAAILAAYPPTP